MQEFDGFGEYPIKSRLQSSLGDAFSDIRKGKMLATFDSITVLRGVR